MRLNYTDDEDFPGQFALWQGNCERSLMGKRGQAALKRLEAALLAMEDKRLIRETLKDYDGNVCALGALAKREGVMPSDESVLDDDPQEFGESVLKFPRLVAWKVVEQNDIQNEDRYGMAEGPNPKPLYDWQRYEAGIWTRREISPEERYRNVLYWVQEEIRHGGRTRQITPRNSRAFDR